MERLERRRWHVSRHVDLGHLLVSIAMLAGFFAWAMSQESRLTKVEAQGKTLERSLDEMREDTKEINRKLDRLIEARK